jgi:RNA polymerase sigma-70 factor (ECF subfamily)
MTIGATSYSHRLEHLLPALAVPGALRPETRRRSKREEPQLLREHRWARRARRGDRRAFENLWVKHEPLVHSILLGNCTEQEAEDLLQDVALAALNSIRKLKQPEKFPAWLSSIARHISRDAIKSRSTAEPFVEREDNSMPNGSRSRGEADEILRHIRNLPECYREPLMLRFVMHLSGPEIAERTGLTPGSVRVNLHRGTKLLRERLERERGL